MLSFGFLIANINAVSYFDYIKPSDLFLSDNNQYVLLISIKFHFVNILIINFTVKNITNLTIFSSCKFTFIKIKI